MTFTLNDPTDIHTCFTCNVRDHLSVNYKRAPPTEPEASKRSRHVEPTSPITIHAIAIPRNPNISKYSNRTTSTVSLPKTNKQPNLTKINQPNTNSEFIRFLRSQSFDIVTFQETRASDPEMQQTLDMKFQAKYSIWTYHCGIVSLNSFIIFSVSLVTIDQRLIACAVSHVDQVFEPFTIVIAYAPASVILLDPHGNNQVDLLPSDSQSPPPPPSSNHHW
ncbi:hypothetical protein G6F43_009636 [Rhizopus delemar]|nr:hypothetical protein G6F43_009636 [Rhizopus delemar]